MSSLSELILNIYSRSSVKHEVLGGSRNADILNSGIAAVLSTAEQSPTVKNQPRLG